MAFWQEDVPFLADVVLMLGGATSTPDDPEAFERELGDLLEHVPAPALAEIQLGPVIQQVTEISARHGVRLPASMALTGKGARADAARGRGARPDARPAVGDRHVPAPAADDAGPWAGRPEALCLRRAEAEGPRVETVEGVERVVGSRPGDRLQVQFRGPELEATIRAPPGRSRSRSSRPARGLRRARRRPATRSATGRRRRSAPGGRRDGRPLRRSLAPPLATRDASDLRLSGPAVAPQHGGERIEQRRTTATARARGEPRFVRPSVFGGGFFVGTADGYRDASVSQALPTGTVTFFFTDIEGSTRLLHELGPRLPGRARAAPPGAALGDPGRRRARGLDARRRVLRRLHRGRSRGRGGGDSAQQHARRPRSGRASATCASGSGIHTGDGVVARRRLRRASTSTPPRASAPPAHGGQVLLTRATRDALATEPTLVELGHHLLKDLEGPIELFRLAVDGPAAAIPAAQDADEHEPARAADADRRPRARGARRPRAAPARTTRGSSRSRGPAAPARRGSRSRSARELVEKFPNGVTFVALGAHRRRRVRAALARRGARRRGVERPLARGGAARATCSERRLLLVLDNFEHVLGAAPLHREAARRARRA